MASQALTNFNSAVDGSNLSTASKNQVKQIGERLFIAGAKETILHLRKHLVAIRDNTNETDVRIQRATVLIDIIDSMTENRDAWWVDITEAN